MTDRRTNALYLIGCNGRPNTGTADQKAPFGTPICDRARYELCNIRKVHRLVIVRADVFDLMPQLADMGHNRGLKWEARVI